MFLSVLLLLSYHAYAGDYVTGSVQDHYTEVVREVPYQVEVCYELPAQQQDYGNVFSGTGRALRGDPAALAGAAIGGAVGYQFGHGWGKHAATAAGAVIGSNLGHSFYRARQEPRMSCFMETRYRTVREREYSHSTARFSENGKQRTVKFNR